MMRSPSMVATAVRRPDGSIIVHKTPFRSLSKRLKVFGLPILRGAVGLIESLQLGFGALSFSAEQQVAEGEAEKVQKKRRFSWLDRLVMPATIVLSLGLGLLIFFYVPLLLTELTGAKSGILFNLIDGAFRLAIFLAYLLIISRWGEMKRVFQYHGAEHKSIAALEAGDQMTPERVARYSRFHPRCGTSYLLIVMLASIVVFMFLGRPDTVMERVQRFLFIPLIGGLAFELTRLSGKWSNFPIMQAFILPGLLLQRITTSEPTPEQLEVAIRSVLEVTRESGGRMIPI